MTRPRFRQLPHTADIRLAVWAENERELLLHATLGAMKVAMGNGGIAEPAIWKRVTPWPRAIGDRLVTVINEALFHLYCRRMATCSLRLDRRGATLGMVILGSRRAPLREIKAATFHRLQVLQEAQRWRAEIILDL